MLTEFLDSDTKIVHSKFQKWRSDNANGFFINCKFPSNWMMHHVSCSHHGGTMWKDDHGYDSLTKKKRFAQRMPKN